MVSSSAARKIGLRLPQLAAFFISNRASNVCFWSMAEVIAEEEPPNQIPGALAWAHVLRATCSSVATVFRFWRPLPGTLVPVTGPSTASIANRRTLKCRGLGERSRLTTTCQFPPSSGSPDFLIGRCIGTVPPLTFSSCSSASSLACSIFSICSIVSFCCCATILSCVLWGSRCKRIICAVRSPAFDAAGGFNYLPRAAQNPIRPTQKPA
jgi:hypothetical protein